MIGIDGVCHYLQHGIGLAGGKCQCESWGCVGGWCHGRLACLLGCISKWQILGGLHPSLEGRGQAAMSLGVEGSKSDEWVSIHILRRLLTFQHILTRSLGPEGCGGKQDQHGWSRWSQFKLWKENPPSIWWVTHQPVPGVQVQWGLKKPNLYLYSSVPLPITCVGFKTCDDHYIFT